METFWLMGRVNEPTIRQIASPPNLPTVPAVVAEETGGPSRVQFSGDVGLYTEYIRA